MGTIFLLNFINPNGLFKIYSQHTDYIVKYSHNTQMQCKIFRNSDSMWLLLLEDECWVRFIRLIVAD